MIAPVNELPGLEKEWFKTHSPAEIIAMVTTITLAKLSTWTHEYLQYLGFLDNLVVDKLYTLTSAGAWIARTDTAGRTAVTEQYSLYSAFSTIHSADGVPVVKATPATVGLTSYQHKYLWVPYATAAGTGVQANLELLAGLGTYFGAIKIIGILPATTVAAMSLTFECPAATAAKPSVIEVALVANTLNTTLQGLVITGATADPGNDGDAIVVDLNDGLGGASPGHAGWFLLEGWYET